MRAYVLDAGVHSHEDLPENAVEITKNDTDDLPPSLVSFLGVYDVARGWIPNVIEGESSYFAVALNAGDTVHFYFSEETEYFFGLLSGGLPSPRLSSVTASVTVDTSGVYALASKNDATVRAYVVRAEAEAVEITDTYAGMPPADIADQFSYTEAEGWHGVTLDMLAGKYLYFAVSLDKGDVLMLDFATEVTFNVAALVGDVQYGETLATSAQIEITETGNYMIIADIATTMRAYVVEAPGTGDDEGGDEGGLTEVDTFEELADAMQHSGEIRLIGDIDMGADEIDVEDGAEITLDLNGYNITATSNYPFDIYDAKLTVVGEGSIKTTGYDVFYLNSSDSVLTVEGGDFESSDNVVYVGEGKATLNGGTYTTLGDSEAVSAGDGTLTITGGAYSTNPSDYLTGSYVAGLDGESGYYVVTSDGVVKVDTFEELVDAMQHSGEIRLIGDIDMGADEIDVEDGAEITLDLNGYNITATSNYPFDIYDAKLTVVGEGSIKTTGYDVFYLNNSSSVLIVEGGSFEADEAAVYASEGKATLNGGIYHDPVLSFASDLTITGGAYSTDPSEYLAEGCVAELDEESGYYVVTEKTSSDEGGDEPTPETITIYLDNAKDWSVVYAYAWNDENPSLLGSWPGTQMTEVEDGIFAVELPVSASYIIFSNGTEQTYDQSIPTNGNNLYNNVDGTWSFYEAPEILESAFRSATVSLGSDLSIIYKIFTEEPLADGENAFGVVFTMNGKETLVTEYEDLGDGVYSFTFTGIAPQQMGDLIDAALVTLDADGAVVRVLCTKEDYSVEANLSRIKEAYAGHTTLQQLIDDLLVYGAAAQSYTGYKTDALVGAGMSLAPSMVEPTAEEAMILIGNTNADVYISAVGLWFDNVNNLYVKIHADVEDPSLVTLQVNDDLYSLADLEDLGNGTFKFTSAALYASAFDTDHIFLLSYDEEIVTELVYSVNAYAYGILQSTTESETMKDLALALYRYGVAAQNYLTAGLK